MRTGLVNFIFNENHDTKILVNPGFQLIFGYPWQGGLLLCHFEIEQAARGTSRGRGNGA